MLNQAKGRRKRNHLQTAIPGFNSLQQNPKQVSFMVQQFLKALSSSPKLISDGWCIRAPNENWFTALKGFVVTKAGQGPRELSVLFRSQKMMWFCDSNLLHFTIDINRSQCLQKLKQESGAISLSLFFSGSESDFIESSYLTEHKPRHTTQMLCIKNEAEWGQVCLRLVLLQG